VDVADVDALIDAHASTIPRGACNAG
jgi:hypothetical protein